MKTNQIASLLGCSIYFTHNTHINLYTICSWSRSLFPCLYFQNHRIRAFYIAIIYCFLFSTFLQFIIIFINKTYCCFYFNGFDLVMNIILIIFIPYVHILPYSIVFVLFFFFINLVRIPYDMYIVISLYVFIFLGFFLNFFFRWFGYFNNNIKRSKKKEMNK